MVTEPHNTNPGNKLKTTAKTLSHINMAELRPGLRSRIFPHKEPSDKVGAGEEGAGVEEKGA